MAKTTTCLTIKPHTSQPIANTFDTDHASFFIRIDFCEHAALIIASLASRQTVVCKLDFYLHIQLEQLTLHNKSLAWGYSGQCP